MKGSQTLARASSHRDATQMKGIQPVPPLRSVAVETREGPDNSVIRPTHNEGCNTERTAERVLYAPLGTTDTCELIIVDDDSDGITYDRARALSPRNRHIQALVNIHIIGRRFVVKRAAKFARGWSVVVLDAEIEIDSTHLQNYVHFLKESGGCVASKTQRQSLHGSGGEHVPSLSFKTLVRLLTGACRADSQMGFKATSGVHLER